MTLKIASDGLPARIVHQWSDEKLFYLERYMDIFTSGMKSRWDNLVYADFFAGPGMCIDQVTGQESEGSPLRALRFEFSHIFLNDADPEAVEALRERTHGDARVRITQLDCNDAVEPALDYLFPSRTASTLGLAFIDPTAFQMQFGSLRKLAMRGRFDLLITFMTNYPRRFISRGGFGLDSQFADFVGREAYSRNLQGRSGIGTDELLDVYKKQLASIGYKYVDDITRAINTRGSTIYHPVFASRSPRGKDFFEKIRQRTNSGQRRML